MIRTQIEEAAYKGDVQKLHNLIKDNSSVLWAAAISCEQTALHTSCIAGHVDFVREVLNLRPEFATELNQDGLSPLHIASAKGDMESVEELLKLGSHLCLVKGKEKRIPLHSAAAKGRARVIRELLSADLETITEVTARGETCFHLAVKSNQFEAFKVLVENVVMYAKEHILNNKDGQGNTILHLAASRKDYEVVDLLLDKNYSYKDTVEVNSLNAEGLTPLDVLLSGGGDCEIEQMLCLAGATRVEEMDPLPTHGAISLPISVDASQDPSQNQVSQEQRRNKPKSASKKLQEYFKFNKIKDSPSEVRNTLLIVAALIAAVTYQAVLNPPGGVWQENFQPNGQNSTSSSSSKKPPAHQAGKAIMGTNNSVSYGFFLVFNSIGYYMSVHMIYFLNTSFPLQFELTVSLTALSVTYATCMGAITPFGPISLSFIALSIVLPLMMPVLTNVVRDYRLRTRRVSHSTRVTT